MANPPDGEVGFVPVWADRAEAFFEKVLVHTKGRWARSPFLLHPWQSGEIIRPLFGTARWDAQFGEWVRLYNEAWLELGRGNGKSELLAGVALFMLTADGEESAEVYGAARDRDQAAIVFNVAARMVKLSPLLSRRLKVVESKRRIFDPKSASVYQVIAADAPGNLGQAPHCIVFDEIIAQPSRDLYDVLKGGLGKRLQPLLICGTTAGNDPEAFAAVEHGNAARTAETPSREPNRLVVVRNTPMRAKPGEGWVTRGPIDEDGTAEVDPFAEKNWHHANPALRSGFLSLAQLRSEAKTAREDLEKENAWRQYRLNQWVSQKTRAISLQTWDASAGLVVAEDLKRRRAFGGLDLAATSDLASLQLLFPPKTPDGDFEILARYWTPAAAVPELDQATGGRFSVWVREGFVEVIDGEVIDYEIIHAQLDQDRRDFGLVDLSLDPWNAAATIAWCQRNRITAVAVPQTIRQLSPPTKELLKLTRARRLHHGGHPVTRWNVDALELKRDVSDNVRPVKPDRQKSGRRIDGVVALILALDGYLRRGQGRRSAYEERGIETV